MRTPLAWRNVSHNRLRALAAGAGVSFAVLLIFMQLGFRSAAARSATLVYDALRFDLLLLSPQYQFLARPRTTPRHVLYRLRELPGVANVTPFQLGWGFWRNPVTGLSWGMMVLAVDPSRRPFRDPRLNAQLSALLADDTVLIDSRTRPEYGSQDVGIEAELAGHRVRVVGSYENGAGFVANGSLITSERTFARLFGAGAAEVSSLGLIELAPGADPGRLARAAERLVAPAGTVVTRRELVGRERHYWLAVKPIGIMFTSGALVAFVVGSVILAQVLTAEVQTRLREYATLKALGHSARSVYGAVVGQALIFAGFGFVPAWGLALVIYALLRRYALLPVNMEWTRVLGVLGLTVAMCLFACSLALQRLRRADPADLF